MFCIKIKRFRFGVRRVPTNPRGQGVRLEWWGENGGVAGTGTPGGLWIWGIVRIDRLFDCRVVGWFGGMAVKEALSKVIRRGP